MEHGKVEAAIMLDPAATLMQNKFKDFKLLSDTRTQRHARRVRRRISGRRALYPRGLDRQERVATQKLTNAIVATLKWIHSHTPEEIMAKMPDELIGPDKALYLAALKNTIPMYSTTGLMDPKGAQAVLGGVQPVGA
jgi:NitT/TauT family transport system substrate-binding protein